MKNMSKEFLLEFFKDADIVDKDGVMTVSNVPLGFEQFVGKKEPYTFVFDIETHNKVKDSELIMQGSYFLLAVRDYLKNKGQTSLLKLQIEPESLKFGKKYKLSDIKQSGFGFLYEFNFISTYQYLNDKKQSVNKILVDGDKVLNTDLSKYKAQKGNKEEIPVLDSAEQYKIVKKYLDERVNKEIKPIKNILKVKLEKELSRVKDHYSKRIKEKDEEVENCANKIKMLQSKLRHTSYERDRNILVRLIRESGERLEMLKQKGYKERLEAEEDFQIKDEVEKHTLSIKNGLMNVTVYYYPLFEIKVGKKIKKVNPILDKI